MYNEIPKPPAITNVQDVQDSRIQSAQKTAQKNLSISQNFDSQDFSTPYESNGNNPFDQRRVVQDSSQLKIGIQYIILGSGRRPFVCEVKGVKYFITIKYITETLNGGKIEVEKYNFLPSNVDLSSYQGWQIPQGRKLTTKNCIIAHSSYIKSQTPRTASNLVTFDSEGRPQLR